MQRESIHIYKVRAGSFRSRQDTSPMLADLTLNTLASLSQRAGINCITQQLTVDTTGGTLLDIKSFKIPPKATDVVGLSCYSKNIQPSLILADELVSTIPGLEIILGGSHFDSFTAQWLLATNPSLAHIVVGQVEHTFGEIVANLRKGDPIKDIAGVFSRKNSDINTKKKILLPTQSMIHKWLNTPQIKRLNPMTLADREEDMPFEDILDTIPQADRSNITVPLRTSYGCEGFCTFCYRPFSGWAGRSPEEIVNWFSRFAEKGYRQFLIVDDNFIGIDKERARRIAELLAPLKDKYPDFAWDIDARADSFGTYQDDQFDHSLMETLEKGGLRSIFTGIETGNQQDAKYIVKAAGGVDAIQQNKYYLQMMARHPGVKVVPGFIMLTEDSDLARITENIEFIRDYLPPQIGPDIYSYFLSYYPGSPRTRERIRRLADSGGPNDIQMISDIVYGRYIPNFKDPKVANLYKILGLTRARFAHIEDTIFNMGIDKSSIYRQFGENLKEIHTRFMLKYLDFASQNILDMQALNAMIENHFNAIWKIVK